VRGYILGGLLFVSACQGDIGGPQGKATGSTTGGTTTGSGPPPASCDVPQAPPLHASLLSPSQYNNVVLDLVKVGGNPSKDFRGGAGAQLEDLEVERRANAAADIARQAAASLAAWSPCMPPAVAADTCEQQIIDRIGLLSFRHPLSTVERTQLRTLFDAGKNEKDFATGVEWFLTGVLQSPDFMYQFARVVPGEKVGEVLKLSSYELASRLSFFIWDTMPDDALHAAAAAGDLGELARLRTELDRMVRDARFMRGVTSFYSSWLLVDGFREVARDGADFTSAVVDALRTSLLMSATQIYVGPSPNVESLFTGQSYYLNDVLRAFYGRGGSGTGFAAVDMPGERRTGILTHPAFMTLLARPHESFPISRGLYVRQILMCQEIPPPPTNEVIPPLAPPVDGKTTRDRLEDHVKIPRCAACHNQFDPPGYAFENFDQVGRYRTLDGGKPVDTSGTIVDGGDLDGSFATGDTFLQRLATSQDIKRCFAQQYFEYATSRPLATSGEDDCSVGGLKKGFAASGDLTGLVLSIASTDSFRFRKSEGEAP
jgi:hypothetical protein